MTYIIDAYALLDLLQGEQPGSDVMVGVLVEVHEGRAQALMSTINFTEVLYRAMQLGFAEGLEERAGEMQIELAQPTLEHCRAAVHFKSGGGISLADCFAAALALDSGGTLITKDPEFERIGSKIEVSYYD